MRHSRLGLGLIFLGGGGTTEVVTTNKETLGGTTEVVTTNKVGLSYKIIALSTAGALKAMIKDLLL
jgi:hypothetical protein